MSELWCSPHDLRDTYSIFLVKNECINLHEGVYQSPNKLEGKQAHNHKNKSVSIKHNWASGH